MNNPVGTVHSLSVDADGGVSALVDVDVQAACARCASGKGCGAGLLSGSGATRQIRAAAAPGIRLSVGDSVEITLHPRSVLHAALLVYGVPLLGAIAAAAAAYAAALGDAASAVAALAGLAAGLAWSRSHLRRPGCLGRYRPGISRVAAGRSGGG